MDINELSEADLKDLEKGILSTKNARLCIMFAEEAVNELKELKLNL